MLTNYHTHHYRCNHASGSIEDYVIEAIKEGYLEIGISCHVPFENFPEMGAHRMDYKNLSTYLSEIDDLREKYPQIRILKSFECEYFPKVHEYMERLAQETDYLILAGHFIEKEGKYKTSFDLTQPEELEIYATQLKIAMKTGLFEILAHPDVFMTSYPKWDNFCEQITREIAKMANECDVVIEMNANGLRRSQAYFSREFWELIATEFPETKVIINSDCHDPELLNDEYMKQVRQMAVDLNLNVLLKI